MRIYKRRRKFQPLKRKTGGFVDILLIIIVFSALFFIISHIPDTPTTGTELAGHAYIIDGDTVSINGVRIRLKGIDAPEIKQSCTLDSNTVQCGSQARMALLNKIGSSSIRCVSSGLDRYARQLARCYLGETDLNSWMVEQGWAVSYGEYQREEGIARKAKRGIWAGQFVRPKKWRKEHARS